MIGPDLYRLRLAGVPKHGQCTILELDHNQQMELEEFAARLLTEEQWRRLDEAQIQIHAHALVDQVEEHLR
jgi:hypothetical protein